jgi:hypothetical protein
MITSLEPGREPAHNPELANTYIKWAGVNQQPPVHQFRMRLGCSSRFGDEPKTHPPLPKVFGSFSLLSAAMFFPPTYLSHLILHSLHCRSLGELGAGGQKREGRIGPTSKRAKEGSRIGPKSKRVKHLKQKCRSRRQKRESKVKGQSRSLKVNSLHSFHFLLLFSCVFIFSLFEKKKMMVMHHCFLLWWCYSEEGDDN